MEDLTQIESNCDTQNVSQSGTEKSSTKSFMKSLLSIKTSVSKSNTTSFKGFQKSGQGLGESIFLSLPVKRNDDARELSASNPFLDVSHCKKQYYLDFKTSMLPALVKTQKLYENQHKDFAVYPPEKSLKSENPSIAFSTGFSSPIVGSPQALRIPTLTLNSRNALLTDKSSIHESVLSSNGAAARRRTYSWSVGENQLDLNVTNHNSRIPSPFTEISLPTDAQWQMMNHLRVQAGAPERTPKGVEKLLNYYSQLCFLEFKFPYETDQIDFKFTWCDAFHPKKKMSFPCFQFEKASVLFNVAAIYSQLASYQNKSNPSESYKLAAHYFQKASGVLVFIRDNLAVRFKHQLHKNSDLSESTLTAIIDLMMGQAAECFWQRANLDKASSAVTSQVAIQASDYYLSAFKHSKDTSGTLTAKSRLPKDWPSQIKCKSWLLLSLAHLHMPAVFPEKSIPERLARLELAKSLALKCDKASKDCNKEIQAFVSEHLNYLDKSYNELQEENNSNYHYKPMSAKFLPPLKRPITSVVEASAFPDVINLGFQDIFQGTCSAEVMDLTKKYAEQAKQLLQDHNIDLNKTALDIDSRLAALDIALPSSSKGSKIKKNNFSYSDDSILGQPEESRKLMSLIMIHQSRERERSTETILKDLGILQAEVEVCFANSAYILENVNMDHFPTDPTSFSRVSTLRTDVNSLKIEFQFCQKKYKELLSNFNTISSKMEVLSWSTSKVENWLSSFNFSSMLQGPDSLVSQIEAIRKERHALLERMDTIRGDVSNHLKAIDNINLNNLDVGSSDQELLHKRLTQLQNLSEKIYQCRVEKDEILEKIVNLTNQLDEAHKREKERHEQANIIRGFRDNMAKYEKFRESVLDEWDGAMKFKAEVERLYEKCQGVPHKGYPSSKILKRLPSQEPKMTHIHQLSQTQNPSHYYSVPDLTNSNDTCVPTAPAEFNSTDLFVFNDSAIKPEHDQDPKTVVSLPCAPEKGNEHASRNITRDKKVSTAVQTKDSAFFIPKKAIYQIFNLISNCKMEEKSVFASAMSEISEILNAIDPVMCKTIPKEAFFAKEVTPKNSENFKPPPEEQVVDSVNLSSITPHTKGILQSGFFKYFSRTNSPFIKNSPSNLSEVKEKDSPPLSQAVVRSKDHHYQMLYDRLKDENDTLRREIYAAKNQKKSEQAEDVLMKWQEKRKTLESKKFSLDTPKSESKAQNAIKNKSTLEVNLIQPVEPKYMFQPFEIISKDPQNPNGTLKTKDSTIFEYKKNSTNLESKKKPPPSSIRISKVGGSKRGGLVFNPKVSQPYIP